MTVPLHVARLCLCMCHFPGSNPLFPPIKIQTSLMESQGHHVFWEICCWDSGSSTTPCPSSTLACPDERPLRSLEHDKVLSISAWSKSLLSPVVSMNWRHALSNLARLILALLKICTSLVVLDLAASIRRPPNGVSHHRPGERPNTDLSSGRYKMRLVFPRLVLRQKGAQKCGLKLMRSALCAGGGRAAERLRGRVARAGARDGDGTFQSLEMCSFVGLCSRALACLC